MLEQCPVSRGVLRTLRKGISKWEWVLYFLPSVPVCLSSWKPTLMQLFTASWSLPHWAHTHPFPEAVLLATRRSICATEASLGFLATLWREQLGMFRFGMTALAPSRHYSSTSLELSRSRFSPLSPGWLFLCVAYKGDVSST